LVGGHRQKGRSLPQRQSVKKALSVNYVQIERQNILNELKGLDFMIILKIQPKNNCNLIHFFLASRQVGQHNPTQDLELHTFEQTLNQNFALPFLKLLSPCVPINAMVRYKGIYFD
jgi:hypothetical protein